MEGRLIAFVIWVIIGVLFIVMGIYDFNSKKAKPFGFWANAEVAPIEDVKGYNRALGILWCVYGVLFTLILFLFLVIYAIAFFITLLTTPLYFLTPNCT